MFRTTFFTLAMAAATAVCTSCGTDNRADGAAGMATDSVVVDTTVALDNGTGAPACRLSLSVKYLKGGRQAQTINDTLLRNGVLTPDYLSLTKERISPANAVDSFVRRFLADYREEYGRMYRSDREHADAYSYEYRVRTDVETNGKGILTYITTAYAASGTARATRQTVALNFNTKTGRMLRLGDIFVAGHEEGLKEAVTGQMLDDFGVDDMEELNAKSVFANTGVYVPENFIIGRDNITFIYCENEIACRDMGEIRVTLPLRTIRKLIRKDYEQHT